MLIAPETGAMPSCTRCVAAASCCGAERRGCIPTPSVGTSGFHYSTWKCGDSTFSALARAVCATSSGSCFQYSGWKSSMEQVSS